MKAILLSSIIAITLGIQIVSSAETEAAKKTFIKACKALDGSEQINNTCSFDFTAGLNDLNDRFRILELLNFSCTLDNEISYKDMSISVSEYESFSDLTVKCHNGTEGVKKHYDDIQRRRMLGL